MRILIAAHGYPPTHSAGAERRAERMARWLSVNGHEVEVLAVEKVNAAGGLRRETAVQDGVTVHRLLYDLSDGDAFRNQYDHPGVGAACEDVLSGKRFDLVHVVSGYLLGAPIIEVPRRHGVPVVVTLTEFWFMCARLNLMQVTGALCSGPDDDVKCARCLLESQRRYRLPARLPEALGRAFWASVAALPAHSPMVSRVAERRRRLHEALAAANLVVCPSRYLLATFARFGFDTARFTFMRQGIVKPRRSGPRRLASTVRF